MRLPQLDERLQTAASFFPICDIGADIGADHGRLSCYLLANHICRRMIVTDISADSLKKAEKLLTLHGLAEKASFLVANGLDALNESVDAVAICGMGGHTISGILRNGHKLIQKSNIILSAHTDIPVLRQTLMQLGFQITEEKIAKVGLRYYIILNARQGRADYSQKELFLGPHLSSGEALHSRDYFIRLHQVETRTRSSDKEIRLSWINEVLSRI